MSKVTRRYGCRVCARRYHYDGKVPDVPPGDILVTFVHSRLPGLHLWMVRRNGWYTAGAAWGKKRAARAADQASRHFRGLCGLPGPAEEVSRGAAG